MRKTFEAALLDLISEYADSGADIDEMISALELAKMNLEESD